MLSREDCVLVERARAGFPQPVAVFTMSPEDMAVLYPKTYALRASIPQFALLPDEVQS